MKKTTCPYALAPIGMEAIHSASRTRIGDDSEFVRLDAPSHEIHGDQLPEIQPVVADPGKLRRRIEIQTEASAKGLHHRWINLVATASNMRPYDRNDGFARIRVNPSLRS